MSPPNDHESEEEEEVEEEEEDENVVGEEFEEDDFSESEEEVLDKSDINYDDPLRNTPLIRAILASDKDEVLSLLSKGAGINVLHYATITPRLLRWYRKDQSVLRHPLDFAATTCSTSIFQLLLDNGATLALSNPLHCVTGSRSTLPDAKRTAMLDYLLDAVKLDINAIEYSTDPESRKQWKELREDLGEEFGARAFGTPLHKAAGSGWEGGVKYLLERGADRSINDTEGKETALDWQLDNEVGDGGYSQKIIDMLTGGSSG